MNQASRGIIHLNLIPCTSLDALQWGDHIMWSETRGTTATEDATALRMRADHRNGPNGFLERKDASVIFEEHDRFACYFTDDLAMFGVVDGALGVNFRLVK